MTTISAVCSDLTHAYGVAVRRLLPGLNVYSLSSELGMVAEPDLVIYRIVYFTHTISISLCSRYCINREQAFLFNHWAEGHSGYDGQSGSSHVESCDVQI